MSGAAFTIFRNSGSRALSKSFSLKDGKLDSEVAAQMNAGGFETGQVKNIDEFGDFLTSGKHKSDCALAYGVNAAGKGFVAAQDAINEGTARKGAIARTKENFPYRVAEPGILFGDIDPLAGHEFEDAYHYDRILCAVVSWWKPLRRIYVPSSSSEIYEEATGKLVSRKAAFHVHGLLDDASQAKSVIDAIFAALIEARYGRVVCLKNGAKVLRSIIDRAVPQGERLDFAFGGHLGKGLRQERFTLPMGEQDLLQTAGKGLADFDAWRAGSAIVRELMVQAEPEAKAKKGAFIDEKVEEAAARGVDRETARRNYERAFSTGSLPPDHQLYQRQGSPFTVGEAIANPDLYHGKSVCDPLEPGYGVTGILYLKGQRVGPTLHSQAHGSQTFRLMAPEPTGKSTHIAPARPAPVALETTPAEEPVPSPQPITDGSNVLKVDFPGTSTSSPVIKIKAGALSAMAEEAEQLLLDAEVPFFIRGGTLVHPIVEDALDSLGRAARSAAIVEVTPAYMRGVLSREITWQCCKQDKEGNPKWVGSHPPRDVVDTIMSRRGEWKFKPLAGVISTPTLRPDGSILDTPGYDEATKLFLIETVKLPPMPEKPTRQDALRALDLLDGLLEDFPFVKDASGSCPSRSVALSLLITPTVRGAMDVVPAHIARAATAGTGKSYLLDTASAIAIGSACPVMSAGKTEEETEKRIGAKALAGQPIINIDNVNGALGGDNLCQIVERPICEIRILGSSTMPRVVNRFCVFATGNNIQLVGDMTRRALICTMDARMERPAEREFKGDPVETVLTSRGVYIAACLTIVRAYIAAGRPKQHCVPMASFKLWSDTVRSALLWLDCADPCATIETARAEDPELQKLSQILGAMRNEIGVGRDLSVLVSELGAKANTMTNVPEPDGFGISDDRVPKYPEIADALADWTVKGKLNTKSFGRWLHAQKMRVVDGHRLACFEDLKRKMMRWYVEEVETPLETPPVD
jgi:putative DNA primase/helicase